MPGFDGTGPRGLGPMTGGARGWCNPYGLLYRGGYAPGLWGGAGYPAAPTGYTAPSAPYTPYGGWAPSAYMPPAYPGAFAWPRAFGGYGGWGGWGMGMGMGMGRRGMWGGRGGRGGWGGRW